jgi:DNA-binding MarR family transcriptional regulator
MTKESSGKYAGRPLSLPARIARIAEELFDAPLSSTRLPPKIVADAIRSRRLRHRYFPEMLFGEPGWDMLLELIDADAQRRPATLTNLSEAAGVPGAVARRWLNSLVAQGLVLRRRDPRDSTSELVELEPRTRLAFRRYFDELSKEG